MTKMLKEDKVSEFNNIIDHKTDKNVASDFKSLDYEIIGKDIFNKLPVGISQIKMERDNNGVIVGYDCFYSNDKFVELAGNNYYRDTFESVIFSFDQYYLKGKHEELDNDSYDFEYNNKEYDKWIQVDRNVNTDEDIITDIVKDITKIKKTNSRIKMYNDLFYSVMSNVSSGIEMYDKNNVLVFMNDYELSVLGLSDQAIFFGASLFNNPIIPKSVFKEIDNKEFVEFNVDCDFENEDIRAYYRTRFKGRVSLNVKIVSIRNRDGYLEYRIMLLNDVSGLERYKNKTSELESIMRKSYFELRTHLNVILGFTELLKDDLVEVERREEYYMIVKESSNRLLDLLSDDIVTG